VATPIAAVRTHGKAVAPAAPGPSHEPAKKTESASQTAGTSASAALDKPGPSGIKIAPPAPHLESDTGTMALGTFQIFRVVSQGTSSLKSIDRFIFSNLC